MNGGGLPPSEREEWGAFGYGADASSMNTVRGDETPRYSTALVATTLHTPSYDHDQIIESLAPDTRSDHTIQVDSGQDGSA